MAGSVGRLCLAIFGTRRGLFARAGAGSEAADDPAGGRSRSASELADDLGVALQLTNIARDLREDAERGRVYLPARDLVRYHLHDDGPLDAPALQALTREASRAEPSVVAGFEGGDVGQLYALMRFQCLRSRDWFHRGMQLVALLDRRSAACVLAMAGIYWRLLHHIEERPDRALARRTRLKKREKAWVAARALVGKGIPERHPAERLEEQQCRRGGDRRGPRGDRGGARLRGRGRAGDAGGGAPAAGRGGVLLRARGPSDGQRPARVPALLHRLPGAARAARQRAAACSCSGAWRSRW